MKNRNRIKPLSLQLANQIAAGEVVERPASVVKELLENAIDAQSSRIEIEIDRGGSSLIRVSDNGQGINKDDLTLAVSRHATSKLHSLSELEKVISLGFRGEALASISAVSKLSLQSRPADQDQAWMINTGTDTDFANYHAEPEPTAHPPGTTIDVRDLFFNTPARRKFMRTVKTEYKHIDDIVKRIALSQFNIAFKLSHNKKLLRDLPKALTEKAIAQRISKLFSPEFLAHANKVDFTSNHFSQMGQIRLWGWVSEPQWHRHQADWQFFYVNGRYIRDKLVNHALRQAYQELLPTDTYPAYLLYLEIAPEQVDVNVHPTKHEVRFRQTRLVHDFIYSALHQAATQAAESQMFDDNSADQNAEYADKPDSHLNINDVNLNNDTTVSHYAKNEQAAGNYVNRYSQNSHDQVQPAHYQSHSQPVTSQKDIAEHLDGLQKLYQVEKISSTHDKKQSKLIFGKPLGCQIGHYLLSQKVSDVEQVQVFAIHIKRAQQSLLKHLFQSGQSVSLLIPQTLELSVSDIEHLLFHQSELSDWGLELNQMATKTLVVRSLPSMMSIPGCKIDITELIKLILLITAGSHINLSEKHPELLAALMKSIQTERLVLTGQERLLSLLSDNIESLETDLTGWGRESVWITLDESGLDKLMTGAH